MSEIIRRIAGISKPLSRRDFLKGMGALATSASKIPLPTPSQAAPAVSAANAIPPILKRVMIINDPTSGGINIRDIFDELPSGDINSPAENARDAASRGQRISDPVGISREDYMTLVQEANAARKALEQAGKLPMRGLGDGSPMTEPMGVMEWNPESKKWATRYAAQRRIPRSAAHIDAEKAYRQSLRDKGDLESLADMGPIEKWDWEARDFDNIEAASQFGDVMSTREMLFDDGPNTGIANLQDFGFAYGHVAQPANAQKIREAKAKGDANTQDTERFDSQRLSDQPVVSWPFIHNRFGKTLAIGGAAAAYQQDKKQSPLGGLLEAK